MTESGEGLPGFTPEYIANKKAQPPHSLERLTTVVFDDEEEWGRFWDYVYDDYRDPDALELTNSVLPMSIRVTPELLEDAHQKFHMRIITREDERQFLQSLKGSRPFDPESLRDRHVPGLDYFRRKNRPD